MGFAVRSRSPNSVLCDTEGWDVVGCGKEAQAEGRVHTHGWPVLTKAETAQDYKAIILHPPGKNENRSLPESSTSVVLSLLSPSTGLTGPGFPADGGRRGRFRMVREHDAYYASSLLSLHQIQFPRLSGIRSQRLGTPALNPPEEKSLFHKDANLPSLGALVSSAHSSPCLSMLNCNVFTCFYYRIGNSFVNKTVLAPPCSWCLATINSTVEFALFSFENFFHHLPTWPTHHPLVYTLIVPYFS